jgi:xylulokinase
MVLGLDLGTTNVKALVADAEGRPVSRGSCPVQLFRLGDGGVEQDIEDIWGATLTAIGQALKTVKASAIQAIGVCSQGGAMQMIRPDGQPAGRVISWLDQRGRPFDDALNAELGRGWFVQRIVHGGSGLCIGQVLRLRQEHPGMVGPPNRIGFVGDVIVGRLCGRSAQDGTSAALTLFYNPRSRAYDPDLLKRLDLRASQFPALLPAGETAGGLRPELAKATGLRAGIPVSPAVHDQYASALGTGAVRAGTLMVGTGTAWVLLAVGDRLPVPANNESLICHHLVAGLWGQILSMVNGGSALTWALEMTGLTGRDRAGIDDLLGSSPPGSDGVWFWPFMTPFGASGLAPGARGRLAGLQLSHRPAHVLRAVVEGLAYEVNRHLDFLRRAGQPIDQLVLGGGAAASAVTPQILADVAGLPLRCFAASEASLVGATILARGLLEPAQSPANLAGSMKPASRSVLPGGNAPFYQEEYRHYLASLPLSQECTA